jgi:cobalt-zinc-cadmium efflux system protein
MTDNLHVHNFHDDHHHHHDIHHHHHHGLVTDPNTDATKLRIAGILQLIYVISIGYIGLFMAHSTALASDSAHVLVDTIVTFVSINVIRIANRPASSRATFGYKRMEVRMAEWNGLLFFFMATIFAMTAVQRLIHPGHVKGVAVVITGLLSLPLSAAVYVLSHSASKNHEKHHHGKKSSARFAQELHALNDLIGVVVTILGGIVIWVWGFERADAFASLIVVASMVRHGYEQLKQTGWILLEEVPGSFDIKKFNGDILGLPDVALIEEIHVWCINEETTALNLRIVATDKSKCHKLQRSVTQIATNQYGVSLATVQVHHVEDKNAY